MHGVARSRVIQALAGPAPAPGTRYLGRHRTAEVLSRARATSNCVQQQQVHVSCTVRTMMTNAQLHQRWTSRQRCWTSLHGPLEMQQIVSIQDTHTRSHAHPQRARTTGRVIYTDGILAYSGTVLSSLPLAEALQSWPLTGHHTGSIASFNISGSIGGVPQHELRYHAYSCRS